MRAQKITNIRVQTIIEAAVWRWR